MKRLKTILQSKYLYLLLIVISFIYVIFSTMVIKYGSKYNNEVNVLGVVDNYKIDGDKVTITFICGGEKILGTYYLKSVNEKDIIINTLKYGSNISLNGIFSDPSNNTIPNTFNYKIYLYNKHIYKIFNINNISIDNSNISLINGFKNSINELISKRNNSDYIKSFIMGDKSGIDSDEVNSFKTLGISHLFAISGMHITLFSYVILFMFSKFKHKNIPIIISLIVLFIYGLLCSFPSSIKRAYVLYLLLSLNKIFKLDIKTMYLFYLTIVINVFIDSFIVYDIGFLYSSLTTYGLIKFNKYLNKGNYIIILLKVSIIAYLFSLPITINNNYSINILCPLNNIFIVPLVSFIIYPLSIITLFIPLVNPLFDIFINLLLFIDNLLLKINIFNFVVPKIPLFIVFIYYLFLILSYRYKKMLFVSVLLILIVKYSYLFDSNYYVYYLDVKQGDSIVLISTRHSDVTLIDTGGRISYKEENWKKKNNNYHLSDNTIMFLNSLGIDKISNLILSHGDADHMGEAVNIVNNIKIDNVVFNCGSFNNLEKELIKLLDKKNISYSKCINKLNDLYFLQTKEFDNENDNSNVIFTNIDNYKFLFMGDASIMTEKEIINKYNIGNIDVLKVGHHGSKTSSGIEFCNEINPKYSIISVGKNNRYGHPNKEVIENLRNSKIFRTDKNGSIIFKIKNNRLEIETCAP